MRRSLVVAFAVVGALLMVTAQPAAAADAGLEVASQNSTDTDFNNAQTLTNVSVSGGDVSLGTTTTDNPFSDNGDGGIDTTRRLVGDRGDDTTVESEVRFQPDETGELTELRPNIDGATGADYGYQVDIYVVTGETPDGVYGEGTLVKQNWDPDHSSGVKSIPLDTHVNVNAGEDVTVEFVTQSTDNDGTKDALQIATDLSGSGSWGSSDGNVWGDYADFEVVLVTTPASGQYVSQTHDAERIEEAWANLTLQNATATVEWRTDTDDDGTFETVVNSSTYTSSGNKSLGLNPQYDDWRANVTFEAESGTTTADLHDESVLFQAADPSGSNADPTGETNNYDGDVSLDVNDSDFGLAQGDSVTVTATNSSGSTIGTTTISSNQTVTFSFSALAGENTITWELSDSYDGDNQTVTQTFSTPGTLYLRNETSPDTLVTTSSNVTVRFFGDDGTIVERTTNDGTVDLSGLPGDTTLVVRVDAEGYVTRKAVITGLFDQQSVYLLNDSVSSSEIVFELSDPTGEFPPGETYLYVEKPITRDFDGDGNNTTEYRTIAADVFGATAAYPVVLADGARYRLRIRSGTDERLLGIYEPSAPATEVLRVDRIEPDPGDKDTGVVYGNLEYIGNDTFLNVRFRGGESNTTVEYNVTNSSRTVIVPNTTTTASSFAHVYNVTQYNNTTTFNVSYTITHADGTKTVGYFIAGQASGIATRLNIDPQVLSIVSWGLILATMGLLVIVDQRLAPAAGVGMASALTILGTVAIPMPLLGIAGAVSVLQLFGGTNR